MPRVFVYGTLLRGERNHPQLAGTRYLAGAKTAPAYTLFDLGPYPALAEGGATAVQGELYEVPDELMPALDAFEGVPTLYQRGEVALADGTRAEAYFMAPELLVGRPLIASGAWPGREQPSNRPA